MTIRLEIMKSNLSQEFKFIWIYKKYNSIHNESSQWDKINHSYILVLDSRGNI
jgi:hypothetical protein